ncbi:hypothetical protein BD779DRAFT_1667660 [Infundibulicybe gibba]|nr:hypothetical protein BD779DRAFT_1667660 [Infundibulicybe gibba]
MDSFTFRLTTLLVFAAFTILSLTHSFPRGQTGSQPRLADRSLALDLRQVTPTTIDAVVSTTTTTGSPTGSTSPNTNLSLTTSSAGATSSATTFKNSQQVTLPSSISSTSNFSSTSSFSSTSNSSNVPNASSISNSSNVPNASSISNSPSVSNASSISSVSPETSTSSTASSVVSTTTEAKDISSSPPIVTSVASATIPRSNSFLVQTPSTSASQTTLPITTPPPGPSRILTTPSALPSSSVISESSGASSGFWQSKPAVVGTFTSIAFVTIGMFITAGVILVRNRRRRETADEEFLFPEPEPTSSLNSPKQSTSEMSAQTPMRVYASHDVFATAQPDGNYQIDYPPGTSHSAAQHVGSYHSDYAQTSVEERVETRTHPLALLPGTQQPAGRNSGYSPSVDSFYGAQGAYSTPAV